MFPATRRRASPADTRGYRLRELLLKRKKLEIVPYGSIVRSDRELPDEESPRSTRVGAKLCSREDLGDVAVQKALAISAVPRNRRGVDRDVTLAGLRVAHLDPQALAFGRHGLGVGMVC